MRIDRVDYERSAERSWRRKSPSVFQALDPSIIKSIDVKEGDIVGAGQLLATLDPTFAAADVEQLKQQIASLKAQVVRATAEQKQRAADIRHLG